MTKIPILIPVQQEILAMSRRETFRSPESVRTQLQNNRDKILYEFETGRVRLPFKVRLYPPQLHGMVFHQQEGVFALWKQSWEEAQARHRFDIGSHTVRNHEGREVEVFDTLRFHDVRDIAAFAGFENHMDNTRARFENRLSKLGHTRETWSRTRLKRFESLIWIMQDKTFDGVLKLVEARKTLTPGTHTFSDLGIPGLDTKWLKRNAVFLLDLLEDQNLPIFEGRTFCERLGFLTWAGYEIWVRHHPKHSPWGMGNTTLAFPAKNLDTKPDFVHQVLFIENKRPWEKFQPAEHTLCVWGQGSTTLNIARDLPWLNTVRVGFWGDLDLDGFAILNGLRKQNMKTESLFMDVDAYTGHGSHLSVHPEHTAQDANPFQHLTPAERSLCQTIRHNKRRLEQEHIHNPTGSDVRGWGCL